MKKLTGALCALLILALCVSAVAETMTISLVGDCTAGDQYKYRGYKSSFTYKITQAGLDYPFSLVADMFAADDLTVANREGVLTDRTPGQSAKVMTLGAGVEFAQVFSLGNVDVCNTANNHAKDFGDKGLEDTFASMEAVGVAAFGG